MELTNTLTQIIDHLGALRSEITVAIGAVLLLITGLFKIYERTIKLIYLFILYISFFFVKYSSGSFFNGWIAIEPVDQFAKYLILISSGVIIIYPSKNQVKTEYYFLLLSAILGSMLMVSSRNLLVLFLSIELVSLSSYFLTNFNFNSYSYEASIKYLLLGAVSSAIMIFGMSWIYGVTGDLYFTDLVYSPSLLMGIVFFSAGLLFKAALVPFQLWAPSAYEAAPTDTVAFFSIVPKIAAFVVIYHLMQQLTDAIAIHLENYWLIIAIATVVVATFAAIVQDNVKRLIAYGAIAHSGFLLPLVIFEEVGIETFQFYTSVYAVMNLGIFYLIAVFERRNLNTIDDYAGTSRRAPWTAAMLVVILISLIGLPPTGGFSAKLMLFSVIYQQYELSGNILMLLYLIIGILSTAVALYYYLKIPYAAYLKPGIKEMKLAGRFDPWIATIFAVLLFSFFIRPDILNNIVLTIR